MEHEGVEGAEERGVVGVAPLRAAGPPPSPAADPAGPLGRALALLDLFAAAGRPLRFSEIERASPLPKATLHRLLRQLEAERMLLRDGDGRHWRLGLRLLGLAHAAWEGASLVEAARPAIERLAGELSATVHLAALDGAQVIYLDKCHGGPSLSLFSRPGRIGPAHCTGVGKAMLSALPAAARGTVLGDLQLERHTPGTITDPAALAAELDLIAARGHAFDDEEHEAGVICVAAAIVTPRGALLGAVSVTTTTLLMPLAGLARHAPRVRAAAAEIAAAAAVRMIGG